MPTKSIELPPRAAKAFVRDTRAFFKAKDQLKRDEIALFWFGRVVILD
jgi:hypothetical protein